MSTVKRTLIPTGSIRIQKAGQVPSSGLADFYVLPLPEVRKPDPNQKRTVGIVSSCVVPFSTTIEGTAIVATFEVVNLHPATVRKMAEAGFVRIEAGYVAHPSRPPQTIFFGRLDKAKWRMASGVIKWTFTASALPSEVWAIKPNASQPLDKTGKPVPITVGEAIRVIADRIGIGRKAVTMPKIFDGDLSDTQANRADLSHKFTESFRNAITLTHWSTSKTAIEELQALMKRVSLAVLESFGVVRNYSLLPDSNNPYVVVIEDVNYYAGEYLKVDLDSPQIIDAGPEESTQAVPATETEADASGAVEAAPSMVTVQDFSIVSVFDPKVSMGVLIKASGRKTGLASNFKVMRGKHTLTGSPLRWRTEYAGQEQKDVEVPRSGP